MKLIVKRPVEIEVSHILIAVAIAEITQEERQMALPMAEEQPPAEQTGEEPPCVA